MATLTVTFKPNSKFPLDEAAAEKAFKGLRTVFDYAKGGAQDTMICNTLVELAAKKDKTLNLPLKNAGFSLDGLPGDEDKRSGEHEMKIKVGPKEVSKNKVWINRPATGINIGNRQAGNGFVRVFGAGLRAGNSIDWGVIDRSDREADRCGGADIRNTGVVGRGIGKCRCAVVVCDRHEIQCVAYA